MALWSLAFAISLATSSAAPAPEIRVVGSDLLGIEFSQALHAFATEHRLRLALAFDGSRPGVVELRAGRADVALLTLPEEESLKDSEFETMVVGYHAVVVIVPATCPLEAITFGELAGAFGGSGAAAVERWGDLGVTGEWSAAPVVLLAPQTGTGLALEYFRRVVLADRALKSNVERFSNPDFLERRFAGEARPLALAPEIPTRGKGMKLVAVAAEAREAAVLPTPATLHEGSYPLRLPLQLAFRRDASASVRAVLAFLAGDEAARHFQRVAIVPVPPAARAQNLGGAAQP